MNANLAKRMHRLATILFMATLGACGTVPPTNVQQPMSARPVPPAPMAATPGAIYVANNNAPLFEIKRARKVGDVLTIVINENNNASKKGDSSAQRTQATDYSVSALAGLPGKGLLGSNLSASSANKFSGTGATDAKDTFTGIITVTVIEVLSNGNMLVSGEKQTGLNQDTQYIRFSGVIDPTTIGFGNTVSSTQVADARLEYRGTGTVDSAQIMGWLAKFFMTFLPF